MKNIDTEKIDTVGQKLGVEFSDIKQKRRQQSNIIIFKFVQWAVAVGSTLLGGILGGMGHGYPFDNSYWIAFENGILAETVLNGGNGIFLLPKGQIFGLTRSQRIKIYLGNLILSFASFLIAFGVGSRWWGTFSSIRYNVFDIKLNPRR